MYELLTVTPVSREQQDLSGSLSQIEKTIQKHGGEVKEKKGWGEKELKFPIQGQTHGVYTLYSIDLTASKVRPLKEALNVQEGILRAMLVKKDEK